MALSNTQYVEGQNILKDEIIRVDAKNKKGLVVIFLSAKCPCSNSHNQELRDLAKNFKDFNFVAIHSNTDEGKELAFSYFEKMSFPFPVIQDRNAKIADELKAYKTPHAFVFSTTGEVLYQGGVSNSKNIEKADRQFLREALEDLQANKNVRTPEGRTLGCVILRG